METILSVTPEHLRALTSEAAVDLARRILLAEAFRQGVPPHAIDVSTNISANDGGVDAEVRVSDIHIPGLLTPGRTSLQVKSGNYSLTDAKLRSLVVDNTGKLHRRVRECLSAGGLFVAFLPSTDNPRLSDAEIVAKIRSFVKHAEPQFESPRVDILRLNKVRSLLELHPQVALSLLRLDLAPFRRLDSWAMDAAMAAPWVDDTAHNGVIADIRLSIREQSGPRHFRLVGEPGIGKTRLALELLRDASLAPLVLYTGRPKQALGSELLSRVHSGKQNLTGILVFDECDATTAAQLWDLLGGRAGLILLTLSTEFELRTGPTEIREIPPMGPEGIRSVLRSHLVHADHLDRWAAFCSGSPRIAHVIGMNLRLHPEDLLRQPDHSDVWRRFLGGLESHDSSSVADRLRVLKNIALFKRFGFGAAVVTEAQEVHAMVLKEDPSITWSRFKEIVRVLIRMRVLQGESTLYITPKALHVWLWSEWWQEQGTSIDVPALLATLSPQLREWYTEMFRYAAASGLAKDVVTRLLGPSGPFSDGAFLDSEEGSRFFGILTEANPDDALRCLERTIGTWSVEKLTLFKTGRRQIVWALEKIVVWRRLFKGGARLLLALADAENEEYGNNATGVFHALFAPAPGRVSATEASPAERLSFMRDEFDTELSSRRLVLVRTCSSVFGGNAFRVLGAEFQGLQPAPELWTPSRPDEIREYVESMFKLLCEWASRSDVLEADKKTIADVLLTNIRRLTRLQSIAPNLIDALARAVTIGLVDRLRMLEQILELLHFDGDEIDDGTREAWVRFRDSLTDESFPGRLHRFVGTRYFIDNFGTGDEQIDQKLGPIGRLASESVAEPELLGPHMDWLTSGAAEDAGRFGDELGRRDTGGQFWGKILNTAKSDPQPQLAFLAGYVRGAAANDDSSALVRLDELAKDPRTHRWVLDVTWRLGQLNHERLERVLAVLDACEISSTELAPYAVGSATNRLTASDMDRFVRRVLTIPTRDALEVALDLYSMHVHRRSEIVDPVLAVDLLTDPRWIEPPRSTRQGTMTMYRWVTLAEQALSKDSASGVKLAVFVIDNFGRMDRLFSSNDTRLLAFLTRVLVDRSVELWPLILPMLGPPLDTRSFELRQWLGDSGFWDKTNGALRSLSPELVWKWVDENVEARAWIAAGFVPNDIFEETGRFSRGLLERYGKREDVRRNLLASYFTEGWSGEESEHRTAQLKLVSDAKATLSDSSIQLWLNEYEDALRSRLTRAKMEEEREDW